MIEFKVIIVEDVPLELKGTEGILKSDVPEAKIVGTAENEVEYWRIMKDNVPDLVLLDLGLGGSTTIGVEICRETKVRYPETKVSFLLVKYLTKNFGLMSWMLDATE